MKRSIHLLFILSILFLGCSGSGKSVIGLSGIEHRIKGEYYLQAGKYDAGITYFIEEINTNPESAGAHHYLGRLYVANGTAASGLRHLKRAAALAPEKADHQFWLGVAHGVLDQPDQERKHYLKTLSIKPRHQRALTYLGHNYLKAKAYEKALDAYDRALALSQGNPSALYGRAFTLKRLGRPSEENAAWKAYLSRYIENPLARNATRHLNQNGDFEYRNHFIGRRNLAFRKIAFAPSTTVLNSQSKATLKKLGHALHDKPDLTLHIVVYLKNNTVLARERAKTIRTHILKRFSGIPPKQIKTSWFGSSETVHTDKKSFVLNDSVNFFTVY